MRRTTRTISVLAALGSAVVAVTLASATTEHGNSPRPPVKHFESSGYEMDDTLPAMATYDGNSDVIQGRIVAVGDSRWNTTDGYAPQQPTGQGQYYIYTPVSVVVDAVYKGANETAGQVVTVRRYGGEVDGTVFSLEGTSTALLAQNENVVVFLQPPHELNDGSTDRIANVVYSVTPNGALLSVEHLYRGTVGLLLDLLGSNGDVPLPAVNTNG